MDARAELTPTVDPHIFIEEQRDDYVRYWCDDGRRWTVTGTCDYRGHCLEGAVSPLLGPRGTRPDVPVGPKFSGCCPLVIKELQGAH